MINLNNSLKFIIKSKKKEKIQNKSFNYYNYQNSIKDKDKINFNSLMGKFKLKYKNKIIYKKEENNKVNNILKKKNNNKNLQNNSFKFNNKTYFYVKCKTLGKNLIFNHNKIKKTINKINLKLSQI